MFCHAVSIVNKELHTLLIMLISMEKAVSVLTFSWRGLVGEEGLNRLIAPLYTPMDSARYRNVDIS